MIKLLEQVQQLWSASDTFTQACSHRGGFAQIDHLQILGQGLEIVVLLPRDFHEPHNVGMPQSYDELDLTVGRDIDQPLGSMKRLVSSLDKPNNTEWCSTTLQMSCWRDEHCSLSLHEDSFTAISNSSSNFPSAFRIGSDHEGMELPHQRGHRLDWSL
jgi:hypothetical protein